MADVLCHLSLPSSAESISSNGTVRRHHQRRASSNPVWSPSLIRQAPTESTSLYTPTRIDTHTVHLAEPGSSKGTVDDFSPDESFKSAFSQHRESVSDDATRPLELKVANSYPKIEHSERRRHEESHNPATQQPETSAVCEDGPLHDETDASEDGSDQTHDQPPAFRRWLSTLRRRKQKRRATVTPRSERWALDDFEKKPLSSPVIPASSKRHRKSDSCTSSIGFVATMKSATVTLASASVAPISRQTSKWRRGHCRSSVVSGSDPRPSVDTQRSALDEAAKQRSIKRRQKIEELIRTEESYVADVKALSHTYFTLLGHQQSGASFARVSARKTIAEMLHLHDDLLGELHTIVPFAEYDQNTSRAAGPSRRPSHARWHSMDAVPQRTGPVTSNLASVIQSRRSLNISRSSEHEPAMLCCSPQVVSAVATAFLKYMPRFRAYEHYGSEYEMVQRDIDETQRLIADWPDFDRAVEALSGTLNSVRSRDANRKKALTVKDLLIKPIQRLPRYELLLADICKLTPVCDDPDAHALIEDVRSRIAGACRAMNDAKDNPARSRTLEATWLLGDRLTFSNQVPKTVFLQLLGEVLLCGCLHAAYRSKGDFIKGSYVACVMFSTTLLLATVAQEEPLRYGILAGVSLANTTIGETDDGKGLQCHTAPHSWKIVFEYGGRMYEIILTACSATEATVWRTYLSQRIQVQSQAVESRISNAFRLHSPLVAEMKSVGAAFGKPESFVRRMSVHRSATVGPTTDLNQVIIKNTQAVKDALDNNGSTGSLQILPRSQSVATPSHVQTLAPRRADRIRLESLLSDVWTKELLPFPGMTVRRSDQLRGSANHVIRKFSMASITSNFSSAKRNGSSTTIATMRKEDAFPVPSLGRGRPAVPERVRPSRLPLADLLPADFDLKDHPSKQKKRNALRAFTMTMERPFSPLLGMDHKPTELRRAQSVRDRRERAIGTPEPSHMGVLEEQLEGMKTEQPTGPCALASEQTPRAKTPTFAKSDNGRLPDSMARPNDPGPKDVGTAAKTPKKAKSKSKLLRLFG